MLMKLSMNDVRDTKLQSGLWNLRKLD